VTRRGADVPARRSSSVSRAWQTGPPPIRSSRAAAGHDRMTRSSRQSSSQGTACGYWIRAWGQREPPHERTGRLKKSPARWPGSLKGGLDIPSSHARCSSLRVERPLRALAHRVWSRTGRVGIAVFASHNALLIKYAPPVVHQPIEQGPGHGAVRVEGDPPSPETGMCVQHKRPGFLTACDHAEQPRVLAC
jgi:hypothetical protein